MSDRTVTLVFVTRNEEIGLRELLPRIAFEMFDDCLAIDGHSVDGTVEVFTEKAIPVYAQRHRGLGAAMLEARERVRTDSFVFYHPDGNEDPDDLARIARLLRQGHDFVVGSRMLPGAWNEEDGQLFRPRKLANHGLAWLANLLFAHKPNRTTDVTNGLRGITCAAFDRMGLTSRDLTMDYQMVIRALKLDIPITEFPTREGERLHGTTNFPSFSTGLAELRLLVSEIFSGTPRPTAAPAIEVLEWRGSRAIDEEMRAERDSKPAEVTRV